MRSRSKELKRKTKRQKKEVYTEGHGEHRGHREEGSRSGEVDSRQLKVESEDREPEKDNAEAQS